MSGPDRQPARLTLALALLFAMCYPAVFTYFYFLALAGGQGAINRLQQATFGVGKVVQFVFPVLFVWITTRRRPRLDFSNTKGVGWGIAFGLLVMGLMLGLYYGSLRDAKMLSQTPAKVHGLLADFDIHTQDTGKYVALAAFYALIHSLLEEYYWRWFVFGQLRTLMPGTLAIVLSSLAFTAHHVIILHVYLPGYVFSAVVPFALGIAVGGAFWAWLYQKSGTLLGPWLSHLLVDAGIFILGWDLWQRGG